MYYKTIGASLPPVLQDGTVMEYVNDIRISRSKELLMGTDMLINEIAPACGFEDASYFCEVFKRS